MNLLWRLLYRGYRIYSWARYWTERRFAPAGLAVAIVFVSAGLVGIDTENTVAYQGFTVLLFLLLVAVVFSWFFRARFSAVRILPRFGTAGHPLNYRVMVKNLTAQRQDGLTLLENLADPRPSFQEWQAVHLSEERRVHSFRFSQRRRSNPFNVATVKSASVPSLSPNQELDVAVELTPLRRGALRFTGLTLARSDPFGLFRGFIKIPAAQSTLILPKRYPLPPLALPGTMRYQEGGVALASNVGQSDEFMALRDYRPGDPMRHIHWRSWARTGKPIVKEFEDEFFVRHALVLDTFTDQPHSDEFEEAVSVAASFACTIQTQESLLDLLFVGTEAFCFTSGRGLAHADQMLEVLASVRECHDKPFRTLEQMVMNHLAAVSGCVCVLMAWNDERREFIRKIRALGVPVMVLVIVAAGQRKTVEPGPMQDEPARFHVLEMGKIREGLAKL